MNAYRCTQGVAVGAWNESSTWNSLPAPAASSYPSFTLAAPRKNEWHDVDVTADVNAWLAGEPNNGWALTIDQADGWTMYSSENAGDSYPRIELTTEGGAAIVAELDELLTEGRLTAESMHR